jgi:mRNA interferase HigB
LLVRIFARKTLLKYAESLKGRTDQRAVESALDAWYHEVIRAKWESSAEVKAVFRNASIVSADRVVFNIKGNSYRLIAAVNYRRKMVYIKWIGPHEAYDRIDARTVEYGDQTDSN